MKSMIKELWHENINPQEDSRNNSPEMKELMEYMARHHDDLLKTMTDEQKEIFEKFEDCWGRIRKLRRGSYLRIRLPTRSAVGDRNTKRYRYIMQK